mmetsp:Transcript_543/g.1480  ORF Transcript_543/g.1480 Transcript_543/m.1480 type:complete len:249 (+) Transcript_543:303-1049(+)
MARLLSLVKRSTTLLALPLGCGMHQTAHLLHFCVVVPLWTRSIGVHAPPTLRQLLRCLRSHFSAFGRLRTFIVLSAIISFDGVPLLVEPAAPKEHVRNIPFGLDKLESLFWGPAPLDEVAQDANCAAASASIAVNIHANAFFSAFCDETDCLHNVVLSRGEKIWSWEVQVFHSEVLHFLTRQRKFPRLVQGQDRTDLLFLQLGEVIYCTRNSSKKDSLIYLGPAPSLPPFEQAHGARLAAVEACRPNT